MDIVADKIILLILYPKIDPKEILSAISFSLHNIIYNKQNITTYWKKYMHKIFGLHLNKNCIIHLKEKKKTATREKHHSNRFSKQDSWYLIAFKSHFFKKPLTRCHFIRADTKKIKVSFFLFLAASYTQNDMVYLPSKTSGARIRKRSRNSKKGFLVGYPAQLILIASKTP